MRLEDAIHALRQNQNTCKIDQQVNSDYITSKIRVLNVQKKLPGFLQ